MKLTRGNKMAFLIMSAVTVGYLIVCGVCRGWFG